MRITKKIFAVVLCMLLVTCATGVTVYAKTVFPVGDWVYEKINDNTEFEVDVYRGTDANVTTKRAYNTLPITSIGENAFTSNTTLKSITFNTSLKYIQNNAFVNVSNLETVVCTSNVELIGPFAFSGCTSLSSINIEDTIVTEVAYSCFMNCDSLTEVTLPETVVAINEQAFAYCDNLSKITIPESVTTIHEKAFYNSPNVVIYCYEDSVAHTFAEANSIEYVLLEPKETYILGDADNDGNVTVLDATFIQLVLAQKIEAIDRFEVRGDSDKDGIVSVMDATLVQQHVADLLDDSSEIGKSFEY